MTYEEAIVEGLIAAKRSPTPVAAATARIAHLCRVSADDLFGDCRKAPVARARWAVMSALSQLGMSSPSVGRIIRRDHTSVLHGLGKIELIAKRQIGPGSHGKNKYGIFTSKYHKPQKEAAACRMQ